MAQTISGDDGTYNVFTAQSGSPALLISGNRNQVVSYRTMSNSGPGPAVQLTGEDNYFRNQSTITTASGVALSGSAFHDEIVNAGTINGSVDLGDGDDWYQNNNASAVGDVLGGAGDDTLTTYNGTVAMHYYGQAGDDYLLPLLFFLRRPVLPSAVSRVSGT